MTEAIAARISVAVQHEDFDLAAEQTALVAGDGNAGGVVLFVGLVRDLNLASDVTGLSLEHYPGMTEKALVRIAQTAAARWPILAVRIVHRVGHLQAGERIVLVAVASTHRHVAFEASAYIMDFLKTEAPFWKKEWTRDGPRWVDARDGDKTAADRWRIRTVDEAETR